MSLDMFCAAQKSGFYKICKCITDTYSKNPTSQPNIPYSLFPIFLRVLF